MAEGITLLGKTPDEWRDIDRRQRAAENLLRRIAGLHREVGRVRPKDEALRYFVTGPGRATPPDDNERGSR